MPLELLHVHIKYFVQQIIIYEVSSTLRPTYYVLETVSRLISGTEVHFIKLCPSPLSKGKSNLLSWAHELESVCKTWMAGQLYFCDKNKMMDTERFVSVLYP